MLPVALVTDSRWRAAAGAGRRTCELPEGEARARRRAGGRRVVARAAGRPLVGRDARAGRGGAVEAAPFAAARAAARRELAQHQRPSTQRRGPLRRPLPAEGVPPAGGGDEPRAGDRPLPERARARACARRWWAPSSTAASRAEPITLAVLQRYVPNEGTAWVQAREELRRFFERVLTRDREDAAAGRGAALGARAGRGRAAGGRARGDRQLPGLAALLGRRTAELHLALASDDEDARLHARALLGAGPAVEVPVDAQPGRQDPAPAARQPAPPARRASCEDGARAWSAARSSVLEGVRAFLGQRLTALRIRTHGDYHLGQVLYTGKDFVIIDFEGPPTETLAERRRKRSPARRRRHGALVPLRGLQRAAGPSVVRDEDRPVPPRGPSLAPLGLGRLRARLPGGHRRARRSSPAPDDVGVPWTPGPAEGVPRAARRARSLRRDIQHPVVVDHELAGLCREPAALRDSSEGPRLLLVGITPGLRSGASGITSPAGNRSGGCCWRRTDAGAARLPDDQRLAEFGIALPTCARARREPPPS